MLNRVLISFTIIFSATFLFTENRDKIDYSGLKKNNSQSQLNLKHFESKKMMAKNNVLRKKSLHNNLIENINGEEMLNNSNNSLPVSVKPENNKHSRSNYIIQKLTFMKKNNLNYSSQAKNSIANKMSLRGYDYQTNNADRDCGACEFDYTPYGSECCDSAWDEFGINCATLESEYMWDCSGCDCLGDGDPVCGDGYCSDDKNFDNCPEDCESTLCDDSGGNQTWISDGWCDPINNNANCDFDGGDCCPCTCVDAANDCTIYGGDCEDCSAQGNPGEICEECIVCEDLGEVECSDGSCADNACNCPQPGCECYDQITCWDNSCADSEELCPENNCDEGYVADCTDEDCCTEGWIGDGLCDGVDQAWGCDLSCYDNDGGDCGPICEDSEVECWDATCATTSEDCPEADCEESGGVESWISDGYCDNSNNNSNCDWDGGDCCGSTCLVSNFDCVGSGEGSYGACYNECLDPNGNDDCCIDNTCPFTCEGNGQVTCWDNSCADTESDCPEITCGDTDCGYVLSWSAYSCPEIADMYGYDCTLCEDSGECPYVCEDDGLITCWDGSCAETLEECPEQIDCYCPEGTYWDGFSCYDCSYCLTISDDSDCDFPYDCCGMCGGSAAEECFTCEDDGLVTCWDGSCVATEADCPLTCEEQGGIDCWDGSCAIDEDCPEQPACDDGYIADCDESGECWIETWVGDGFCDGVEQQYGADLCCYDNDGGDCTEVECGGEAICGDGTCDEGETEESCPEDCAPSTECMDCEFDYTNYGSECCDSAWEEFGISCADLESSYYWDCAGCNCPGDDTSECGDGECNGDETEDSCPEDCTPACENELGDVNGDGTMNVLDIVQIANHILGATLLEGCALDVADYTQDGLVNVLDIVQIANVILNGGGRVNINDASSVKIIQMEDKVLMDANGFVGAVQMKLQHGSEFEFILTQNALLASFNTIGNDTKLIIVAPENNELFSYKGEVEIVEIIAANSKDYIDVISIPADFALHSAYPNPFNPVTTISYSLPTDADVLIQVINLYGRVVETLTNSNMNSGYHAVNWNADSYSSGLYFVKMVADPSAGSQNSYTNTQKLILVK